MKTKLKIKFTDFYDVFIWNGHCLYKYLNQYFELELSDTPDLIIYSCYGTEFLKYTLEDFPEPLLKANHFLQNYFKPKIWGGYNDSPSKDVRALQDQPYSAFKNE